MRFLRQEYWSGLQFPSPGHLPNPGIKPTSLGPPAWAGGFLTTAPPGENLFTKTKSDVVIISILVLALSEPPCVTQDIQGALCGRRGRQSQAV